MRLDILAIASSSITAFLVIALRNQISPALAGLAMAYAMQMTGVFQYTVRLMAETETRFISVERISYYLKVRKSLYLLIATSTEKEVIQLITRTLPCRHCRKKEILRKII